MRAWWKERCNRLGGFAVAAGTRGWMATLSYRGAMYAPQVDPVHPQFRRPVIFLFWHEYIPFLFYLRGHCNVTMLLSRHNDAEWLSQAARFMGFGTVRGSTNRGGTQALRALVQASRGCNLAITPDGPRGPRRELAPGAIFLSSKLQIPLVAVGIGYRRCYRLPTWDRFALPYPGTAGRAISSPPIQIPAGLSRKELDRYRLRVQHVLNRLSDEAEEWARDGSGREGQAALRKEVTERNCRRAA